MNQAHRGQSNPSDLYLKGSNAKDLGRNANDFVRARQKAVYSGRAPKDSAGRARS
jgi:hypothetical protein